MKYIYYMVWDVRCRSYMGLLKGEFSFPAAITDTDHIDKVVGLVLTKTKEIYGDISGVTPICVFYSLLRIEDGDKEAA